MPAGMGQKPIVVIERIDRSHSPSIVLLLGYTCSKQLYGTMSGVYPGII